MDDLTKTAVFRAQVPNVRALEAAIRHLRRSINLAMRKGDGPAERTHTLTLAVTYCAWLEAFFSKLIHTPFGLNIDEIRQIKAEQSSNGITAAWHRCVSLALQRVSSRGRSNYLPNIEQRLEKLVDEYVGAPSVLRNKIAHGQWSVALNRENDAVNPEISKDLAALDVVTIDRWRLAVTKLAAVVEALIESPDRAFHRDYWVQLSGLEEQLKATEKWTRQSKVDKLTQKPVRPTPNMAPNSTGAGESALTPDR